MLRQGEQHIMQFMQMLKASLTSRRSALATMVMVGVVASAMGLMPTHGASNTLAETCANPPTTPTFNYWPVTYDDANTPFCHDFPAIDAVKDVPNPVWSQSEADWNDGLTLNVGDTAAAGLYLHNGAANNLPASQTTAKNVHIITQTDTAVGPTHQIKVTYTADNAATYTKTFTIHTPADAQLEVIPNSGYMYDYQGRLILDQQNLNLGNSDYFLGDLDACFEYSIFLTYKFKVVRNTPTPTNTSLSIEKGVHLGENTGRGGQSYTSSVSAKKGDKVGYRISVSNTGTSVAKNVTVTDNGVSGISIDPNSVMVGVSDDAMIANNLWSGTIPGTINLGDIPAGGHLNVYYTGTVTADNCPTLINTARAGASNSNNAMPPTATATVVVTRADNCTPVVGQGALKITKEVKNNTAGNWYTKETNAKTGDIVNFRLTVTNTGNASVNNVKVVDTLPNDFQFADNVAGDGTPSFSNGTLTVNFGTLTAGQTKTVEFSAKVTGTAADADKHVCNTGTASGDGVASVNDQACVNIARVIIVPTNPKIAIKKFVKNNSTNTSYSDDVVNARTGERVNFKVTVSNPGDATLNNVKVTDVIPSGLKFDNSVTGDGTTSINGTTFTVDFGSIAAGQSKTVEFAAQVLATATNGDVTICNIAKGIGTGVSEVSDNACVKIYTTPKPGESHIVISKKAWNDTKNIDATTKDAARGDYITYSLVVTNDGTADKVDFVIEDDLSGVLPLADMVSTNGGTVSGNMIRFPSVTIKPGETVVKTFKVRIKQTLDKNLSFQLRNTYGNTIVINVPGETVYEAPKTGAAGTSAGIFAGLLTAGFVAVRKRNAILKFIFA